MSSENLRVSGNAAYVFGTLGKDKFNLFFLIGLIKVLILSQLKPMMESLES